MHTMSFRITFSYRIGKMSVDAPKRRRSINNDDLKEGGDNGGGQDAGGAQGGGGGQRGGGQRSGGFYSWRRCSSGRSGNKSSCIASGRCHENCRRYRYMEL